MCVCICIFQRRKARREVRWHCVKHNPSLLQPSTPFKDTTPAQHSTSVKGNICCSTTALSKSPTYSHPSSSSRSTECVPYPSPSPLSSPSWPAPTLTPSEQVPLRSPLQKIHHRMLQYMMMETARGIVGSAGTS